jgi:hypothetical protein
MPIIAPDPKKAYDRYIIVSGSLKSTCFGFNTCVSSVIPPKLSNFSFWLKLLSQY